MKKDRLLWVVLAAAILAGCPEDRRPATEASPIPPSADAAPNAFDAGPMPAGGSPPGSEVKPEPGQPDAGKPVEGKLPL